MCQKTTVGKRDNKERRRRPTKSVLGGKDCGASEGAVGCYCETCAESLNGSGNSLAACCLRPLREVGSCGGPGRER
jgi:hypothetical protein